MQEVKGKYNTAKVFTDVVDEKSLQQIQTLCDQEFTSGARIRLMPDVHAGAGCTIGTTMTIKDKIVPNLVGVDIGCGIISFLPIDSISISRISHPNERFLKGMDIRVIVKNIENDKINLTHKELLGTWEENAKLFSVGETVGGIIRSVEDYGIFVELTPNLAGLAEVKPGVTVGQHSSVYIKNIIPSRMKIKLIIIDVFDQGSILKVPNYFYTKDHMSKFLYSPVNSNKVISSLFK